jgi:hypothetical protein
MEPNTIIALTRKATSKLNLDDCSVRIVENGTTFFDEGDGSRQIPKWGVRITRADGKSTRINFDTVPEHSEDQITNEIVDLLRHATWK